MRIADSIQSCPDPEDLALRLWAHDDKLLHTRLNYWIVTESILLAAYAALAREMSDWETWTIRLLIAISGFLLTLLWYFLFIRSWNWIDHWFTRAQAIHFKRYGRPKKVDEVPPFTILPEEEEFAKRCLLKGGLGIRKGGRAIMAIFLAVWVALAVLSLVSLLME